MNLANKIKRLERSAAGGVRCNLCGLPRHGLPAGTAITTVGPSVIAHMREIAPYPPVAPCGVCGRRSVFEIPVPERARGALGVEAAA